MAGLTALGALALTGVHAEDTNFTTEQTRRGEAVYQANCAACHGTTLMGGPGSPALGDMAFRARWTSQPPQALLAYIRANMPPGGGALDAAAYADVTAWLLKANNVVLEESVKSVSATAASPSAPAPERAPPSPMDMPPDDVAKAAATAQQARLARLTPVTDAMLRDPPQDDWINWRRTYDAHGFSPLTQVNRKTVANLRSEWSYQLAPGTNEVNPLVHDGIMFVASSGRLEALDATNGEHLWHYARPGINGLVRNLAIYDDLVYLAAETSVVALDMRSGKVVWDRQILPGGLGVRFGSGPVAAKGKIFQGLGYCVAKGLPGGCFIVALDARNGEEIWRFNTIAQPGKPGGDSWNVPLEQRFGSSIWLAGSYDPELDLLYFGTGQTYQINSLLSGQERAAGLYTDSTLALRPDTGELVWHYQHMDGDVWDMDWAFERTLATLTIDGKPRRTVTTAGKLGIFDTLDAATGQYLFSTDAGYQNLVTAIDPATGAKRVAPALLPEEGKAKHICPSSLGGRNWMSSAYDPHSGIVYLPRNATCTDFRLRNGNFAGSFKSQDADGLIGAVQAIDIRTRKTLWTVRSRAPQSSAILATAGGLIFEGSRDRWFRAHDNRTGKVLWQTRLDSSVSSFPITYAVGGVQYVAVTAGGGGSVDSLLGRLTPEIVTSTGATTLWVFRLSEQTRQ